MAQTLLRLLVLASAASTYVAAAPNEVTLVVPFLNSTTAVAAEVLGVDSQGHTTYAVADDDGVGEGPVTATLVEGSDHVFFTAVVTASAQSDPVTVGFDCALQSGNAICTDLDENSKPVTDTESAADLLTFVLDVTATASTAAPSGSAPSAGSSAGSGAASNSGSGSGTGPAQPSQTGKPGSAMRNIMSTPVAGVLVGMLVMGII